MSNFSSCIYSGLITHKRFKPKKHFFTYKAFSLLIDLNEIEKIEKVEKIVLKPGTFFVELGSYRTKDKAKKIWLSLSKGNSLIFKNKEQLIQDVSTNSSKLFKLRVVGFVNIIESRVFCDQLRDWGTTCLPMRAE